MATRKPLVVVSGTLQELPAGDSIPVASVTGLQDALDSKAPFSHVGSGGTQHANVVAAGDSGFMTGADKTKLDGVSANATANATNAQLRDRATHTGAQAISTVTGLQTALDAKLPTDFTSLADSAAITGTEVLAINQTGVKRSSIQKVLDWILGRANTWTGKQTFNGFTQLGDAAPGVKQRKFVITLPTTANTTKGTPHNLLLPKIIGVQALAASAWFGNKISPTTPSTGTSIAACLYTVSLDDANINIFTGSTADSSNVFGSSVAIIITYEE